MDHIIATHDDCQLYTFTPEDIRAIEKIRDEKYATEEWNYGHSPAYSFQNTIRTEGGTIEMNLDIDQGIIRKAKIYGDFFNVKDIAEIEQALEGVKHTEKALRDVLRRYEIPQYFMGMTADDLIRVLF